MTDVQAALGVSQLRCLDHNVEIRNQIALRYDEGLKLLPLRLPGRHPDNRSAFHIYVVRLKDSALARGHLHVFNELRGQGIGVNLHYLPVHLQPYYRALGFSTGQFPEAEAHGREAITLPMYPGLTGPMQEQVLNSLHKVLAR
jgi:dTDP-4-amino-4,6-dideoxygalactose transaminase